MKCPKCGHTKIQSLDRWVRECFTCGHRYTEDTEITPRTPRPTPRRPRP